MGALVVGFFFGIVLAALALQLRPTLLSEKDPGYRRRELRLTAGIAGAVTLALLVDHYVPLGMDGGVAVQVGMGLVAGVIFRRWLRFLVTDLLETSTGARNARSERMIWSPEQLNRPNDAESEESNAGRWWTGELWRDLLLMAILVIGGLFVPYVHKFSERISQDLSRLKIGEVEVEMRHGTTDHRKVTLERTRNATQVRNVRFLAGLTVPFRDGIPDSTPLGSDFRDLERRMDAECPMSGPPSSHAQKLVCGGRASMDAFATLYRGSMLPVINCLVSLASERRADVEGLRDVIRKMSWDFRQVLRLSEVMRTPMTEEAASRQELDAARWISRLESDPWALIENATGMTFAGGTEIMRPESEGDSRTDIASDLKCARDHVAAISIEQAKLLSSYPWSYLMLAMLDYAGGDRMAAIEEMEIHRGRFPHVFNFDNLLGQYWSTEGSTAEPAVDANARFLAEAREFLRRAKDDLAKHSTEWNDMPLWCCRGRKSRPNRAISAASRANDPPWDPREYDVMRGAKAVAIAQNAWAWDVTQLPLEDSSKRLIRQAIAESESAVRYYFWKLGGYDDDQLRRSVGEVVLNDYDGGLDFWGAVDTAAYAVLVGHVHDSGTSGSLKCAVQRLSEAKRWFDERFKERLRACESRDPEGWGQRSSDDSAARQVAAHQTQDSTRMRVKPGDRSGETAEWAECKLRVEYAVLDSTYQMLQGHLKLADAALDDISTTDRENCAESDRWALLRRDRGSYAGE